MKPPLVTVLIGNFNYGRFIHESVQSVLDQTYRNVEIIVIDDGSTDNSRDVIDKFSERVRKIYIPNGGQSNVFSVGLAASNGAIVCMLDSDDYFYSDKIAKIVEIYEHHPEIDFLFHAVDKIDTLGRKLGRDPTTDVTRAIGVSDKARFSSPPTTGTTYRRQLLSKILPIPKVAPMGADNFTKFAAMSLAKGLFVPETLGVLRLHGSNHGSMGMPIAKRLNHDAAIALALHQKFPSFSCIERLMAISLARFWIIQPRDSSKEMIAEYVGCLSMLHRLRLYFYALLFYSKRKIFGLT